MRSTVQLGVHGLLVALFVASAGACSSRINFDDDDGECGALPDFACAQPCDGAASSPICVDGSWECPPPPPECDCDGIDFLDCVDACGELFSPSCINGSAVCVEPPTQCAEGALWGRTIDGTGYDGGDAIARDASGNVIVAGHFTDSLGSVESAGGADLLVTKLDPSGTTLWTRGFGSAQDESVVGVAARPDGSIVVAAAFLQDVDVQGTVVDAPPGGGLLLMELDAGGDVEWARAYDVYPDASSRGLALDSLGNILVAGTFWTATANLGGAGLVSGGGADLFIAKLDEDGDHTWSRALGDGATQSLGALANGEDGGVLLTGYNTGSIALESGTLTADSEGEGFAIELSPVDGQALWGRRLEGSGQVRGTSMASYGGTGAVVVGTFMDECQLDDLLLQANGGPNAFVAVLDDQGNVMTARALEGVSFDLPELASWNVAVDASGDIVVAGQLTSSTDLATPGVSAGGYDLLLVKLQGSLQADWGRTFGDASDQWIADVAIGPNGDIAITGSNFGVLDLGSDTLFSDEGTAFAALFGPEGQ